MSVHEKEIYITGSKGFVGSKVCELAPESWNKITPEYEELDITDLDSLRRYFDTHSLKVVINFAAITDVDGAERERNQKEGNIYKVNVLGAVNCANLVKEKGGLFIQISTDFVFTGKDGPFKEDDPTQSDLDKIGWYGWTKKVAEDQIRDISDNFAIIRICFPTGNFVSPRDYLSKLILGLKKGYSMYEDQKVSPTYIPDLANTIDVIVRENLRGIFHVATYPVTTPYEIANLIAEIKGIKAVEPGQLGEQKVQKDKSPRPLIGGLDCGKTQDITKLRFHSWEDVVRLYCSEL